MNTKTSILMAKARRPLGCGVRKFGILLTVMAAAIIALPNTVTNDVVVATSDAELRISDRGLGLGLEVVGGGAAEVKLEARPGWRFRDGSTSVTLNKAAGKSVKSPNAVGEGQNSEGSATVVIVDGGDDDDENGDGEGSVEHEKPILSMTATAPKVVAYSVQDGGTNVSISLSATVTTNGKHRKLDANGNVVKEEEFSPKRYVWKMTGVATGEAETDSSTHTFTVNLTKGESKWLNFSVVGKTCSICDGEVESDAATDSVEIDVYELSISRPDYLGLDRTDAGRQGHVVKTATLSSDPSLPSSSSVEWTECGICEFVGARDQLTVSYQNKDSETASGEYLAERLAASVRLAGMDSSVVCSTNFTVVKVDVVLSGVGEDGDETAIPSVYYIVDEDSGSLSKAGLRHLYPVAVACVPADVPGLVGVAIDVGAELYEITESSDGVPTLAVPAQKAYLGCEIGHKRFGIHGHSLIGDAGDEKLMSAVHRLSNAIDHAHVKVASPPPLEVSVQLNSPAEGGGWPYDPVWDDPEWAPTVNGSLAKQCAEDTDNALVIYTLSRDAKTLKGVVYKTSSWPDEEVDSFVGVACEGVHTNFWEIGPTRQVDEYYAKVFAEEKETDEIRRAKSNEGGVRRECYYFSDSVRDPLPVSAYSRVTLAESIGPQARRVTIDLVVAYVASEVVAARIAAWASAYGFTNAEGLGFVSGFAISEIFDISHVGIDEKWGTQRALYAWNVTRYDWKGTGYIKYYKPNPNYNPDSTGVPPVIGPHQIGYFPPEFTMLIEKYRRIDGSETTEKTTYRSLEKGYDEGNENTSKWRWENKPYQGGYGMTSPQLNLPDWNY